MEWKPIKRLLIPFDFSSNSKKAVEYALDMAKKINCQLLLFHVHKVPVVIANEFVVQEIDIRFYEEAKKELEEAAEHFRKSQPNIKIETGFSKGLIVDEIISASVEKNIDMIIMGTRGAHGIEANFFGSNTADVIGKSSIPVLAIPEDALYKPIDRVVFTTSFLENDFQTLFQLTELMKPFNAQIEVLHVEEKGDKPVSKNLMDEFMNQVKTNIPYKKISFKILEGNNVELTLEKYVEGSHTNLIAIASKRRNFFERFTERSLSRKLAFHTRIPLLVFHSFNKTSYPIL